MRWIVLLCLLMLGNTLCAQTAVYRGRAYTPASFPRAMYCSCGMCQQIRAQWARQRTVTRSTRIVVPAQKNFFPAPAANALPSSQPGLSYRLETRTRRVPYQVKVCHGRYCTIETRYRTESYQVRVPVGQPAPTVQPKLAPLKPKLQPVEKPTKASDETSPDFARAVLEWIAPGSDDVVYDLGCGNGELLAAAAPYGCTVYGIEIDEDRAKQARWRVPAATVVWGDMLHQNYTDGNIFLMYLFPDLMSDVLSKLPRGSMIVSLEHDVPGMQTYEHRVSIDGKQHRFFVGVKG
jgi:hypothetical protein